jgi:hypothetical protein
VAWLYFFFGALARVYHPHDKSFNLNQSERG